METASPRKTFKPPPRPPSGEVVGRRIDLLVNYFTVKTLPRTNIHHYDVTFVPDQFPKRVKWKLIATLFDSGDRRLLDIKPAYDGSANLYTARALPIGSAVEVFEVKLDDGGGPPKTFKVKIKLVSLVDTSLLQQFAGIAPDRAARQQQALITRDQVDSPLMALEVALRYGPSCRFTQAGRSFFSLTDKPLMDIGNGMAVWSGFNMSIRPNMWGHHVVLNTCHSVFYKNDPMLKFLSEVASAKRMDFPKHQKWTPRLIQTCRQEVKGLKIEVNNGGQKRRYRVIDLSNDCAEDVKFDLVTETGSTKISVAQYFASHHKRPLSFPKFPCLQVGRQDKPTFIPIEVSVIASGQRVIKKLSESVTGQVIRAVSRPASERKQAILQSVARADLGGSTTAKQFGLSIEPTMLAVKGRVLDPPLLKHAGDVVKPRNGAWEGLRLTSPASLTNWALVNMDVRQPIGSLKTFFEEMSQVAYKAGMNMKPSPCEMCMDGILGAEEIEKRLRFWAGKWAENGKPIEMFFLILPQQGRSTSIYSAFKHITDVKLGIPSQCIDGKTMSRRSGMIFNNILLKINGKIGGVNFVIEPSHKPQRLFSEPVIIMGADVTHPGIGNVTSPSVAAVVGSLDSQAMKYAAQVHVQTHRKEIIVDLEQMTKKLLLEFFHKCRVQPQRIIFYRDGVSEGMFATVLNEELTAIRKACLSLNPDYKPGITFITVQKRHSTRLFPARPQDAVGKSGNVPAGTLVDTGIVHPTDHDFFLCSHHGIQGTSRPAHYYVLWDDNRLNQSEVQQLTYMLCHTYARCMRSVSIPAPAYYAHLVAFRAKVHLESQEQDQRSQKAREGAGPPLPSLERFVSLSAEFTRSMYFL